MSRVTERFGRPVRARGLSLRGRLAMLVVLSVIPLLAFILGYQYLEYRKDVANTGRQTLSSMRDFERNRIAAPFRMIGSPARSSRTREDI